MQKQDSDTSARRKDTLNLTKSKDVTKLLNKGGNT